MSRKKILIVLLVVMAITALVSYRIVMERQAGSPEVEEDPNAIEEPENGPEPDVREELQVEGREISLQYLGHSSFLLEVDGFSILMDPYSPQVGYGTLEVEADLVTVSHEHLDHNYVAAAPGARVIRGLTADGLGWDDISLSIGKINIFNVPTYHDEASGKMRGRNSVFIFDIGELRLVHLGDLGHVLGESEVERIAPVHVLMVPVGGHYTIDAGEAEKVVDQLSPAVAVPMHYRTEATRNWPISGLEPFLEGRENVRKKDSKPVHITMEKLPETTEVWVMEPVELD